MTKTRLAAVVTIIFFLAGCASLDRKTNNALVAGAVCGAVGAGAGAGGAHVKNHGTLKEGEWLRVVSKHGKPPGYIDQRFARPAGPESAPIRPRNARGTYKATADIQVREGPGLHYRTVATIREKTEVMVVGSEGDWLKVISQHGNPPGYIERRYAERVPG